MTRQQIYEERMVLAADLDTAESEYEDVKARVARELTDLQARCQHANTANVGDGSDGVECSDCGKVMR